MYPGGLTNGVVQGLPVSTNPGRRAACINGYTIASPTGSGGYSSSSSSSPDSTESGRNRKDIMVDGVARALMYGRGGM